MLLCDLHVVVLAVSAELQTTNYSALFRNMFTGRDRPLESCNVLQGLA